MDSFQTRVSNKLSTYYTYSRLKEAMDDKDKLKEVATYANLDGLQGLIYFHDQWLYSQLWSKPPSKACLKAAIVEVCDQ